jgi:adenylate cyclase
MRFQLQLYLWCALLIFGTTCLGLGLFYKTTRDNLFDSLRSNVLTVAETSALIVDGDLLETIQKRDDVHNPNYRILAEQMRGIRDANRRDDLYVIYIYTIRPFPNDPKKIEVVVTSAEDPKVFILPGEEYPEGLKLDILNHLGEAWTPNHLIKDRWGTFLVAYAPVYNSQGKYVATLGVNLSAEFVLRSLEHLKRIVFSILAFSLVAGLIASAFLSTFITNSLKQICAAVSDIGRGHLKTRISMQTDDEFGALAKAVNDMAQKLEEHQRLKSNFTRYVSQHVLEKILSSEEAFSLKGERKKITVLFSDIREFTRLSEELAAEEVVSLLNEYLERMLNVVFANHATLDKFIGDGLMLEFGAPLTDPLQERHALKTAVEMQLALKALNQEWKKRGRPQLEMGIGINTGLAVVGNIGSEKRVDYTAIGDTVNVASRLEKATKEFRVSILVSEKTFEQTSGAYPAKKIGALSLPGHDTPIIAYAIEVEK